MTLTMIAAATSAFAQSSADLELERKARAAGMFVARAGDALELQPLTPKAGVRNAPFSAEAVTEFTQILGDGNRIERSYSSSIARDGQGRTRREQEVAMLGPLAGLTSDDAMLIVISDPVSGREITLDEKARTFRESPAMQIKGLAAFEAGKGGWVAYTAASSAEWTKADALKVAETKIVETKAVSQPLGTRTIEGVSAEGTRTTMTIPAGSIGNVNDINVVTERWFSKDLQMDVLISRRDPRSGDTIYRLRNIVRSEPPPDLFTVPAGYRPQRNWKTAADLTVFPLEKLEREKLEKEKLFKGQKSEKKVR